MGPQSINPAVRGRAVGTNGSLGGVRVEVVPAIGDFFAARTAPPHGAGQFARRREHVVVGHLVMVMMVVGSGGCCGRGHCQDVRGGAGAPAAAGAAHGVGPHQRQVVVEGAGAAAKDGCGLEGQVGGACDRGS